VGRAALKSLGANVQVMDTKIFRQEQSAQAVMLGLGVAGPDQIEIATDDDQGRKFAAQLTGILRKEG
jgi:hypothetical protein